MMSRFPPSRLAASEGAARAGGHTQDVWGARHERNPRLRMRRRSPNAEPFFCGVLGDAPHQYRRDMPWLAKRLIRAAIFSGGRSMWFSSQSLITWMAPLTTKVLKYLESASFI